MDLEAGVFFLLAFRVRRETIEPSVGGVGWAVDGIYDSRSGWENSPLRRKRVAIVCVVWEKGQRCHSK